MACTSGGLLLPNLDLQQGLALLAATLALGAQRTHRARGGQLGWSPCSARCAWARGPPACEPFPEDRGGGCGSAGR